MTGRAVLSPDGLYRYALEREWPRTLLDRDLGRVLFVMLNPSTADGLRDDPTVRRCVDFAQRWGYSSLTVVNLFAWRATDPRELALVPDPVGPDNDAWIRARATVADRVVAAWGARGDLLARDRVVLELLRGLGHDVRCLGVTRAGMPRHPLYLPGKACPRVSYP